MVVAIVPFVSRIQNFLQSFENEGMLFVFVNQLVEETLEVAAVFRCHLIRKIKKEVNSFLNSYHEKRWKLCCTSITVYTFFSTSSVVVIKESVIFARYR